MAFVHCSRLSSDPPKVQAHPEAQRVHVFAESQQMQLVRWPRWMRLDPTSSLEERAPPRTLPRERGGRVRNRQPPVWEPKGHNLQGP